METAASIIKSALQEIVVQASEAPIEADEAQDAIKYMNRMMAAFAADGINVGYTAVTNLGTYVTVPEAALEGIVFNLAKRLAPSYGAQASQQLLMNARAGMETLAKISTDVGPTQYPSTLPIGSGNRRRNQGGWISPFYPGEESAVLREDKGFIATESETAT